MGYTTDFEGTLKPDRPIPEELVRFINKFAETRHVKRDVSLIEEGLSLCENGRVESPIEGFGVDGEFFIPTDEYILKMKANDEFGRPSILEDKTKDVVDYNMPPKKCPGLWCCWHINEDGELEWNGAEKFYNYKEWLIYLIENFFKPSGINLTGEIAWRGEDFNDMGVIVVKENKVAVVNILSLKELVALLVEKEVLDEKFGVNSKN